MAKGYLGQSCEKFKELKKKAQPAGKGAISGIRNQRTGGTIEASHAQKPPPHPP